MTPPVLRALIGGASQGLGAAVAENLAQQGIAVTLIARTEEKLQQMVNFLNHHHPIQNTTQHRYLVVNQSDPAATSSIVQHEINQYGNFDILINNSGGPNTGPLIETSWHDLQSAFTQHLGSAHLLAQLVVPSMKEKKFGRIINITSTSAKEPLPMLGISNIVRAALSNWAKTLATELAQFGITVNNVLPGYTDTERLAFLFGKQAEKSGQSLETIYQKNSAAIPAGRLGHPKEFAAAVGFLCSSAAAYINGVNLPVDGGKLQSL